MTTQGVPPGIIGPAGEADLVVGRRTRAGGGVSGGGAAVVAGGWRRRLRDAAACRTRQMAALGVGGAEAGTAPGAAGRSAGSRVADVRRGVGGGAVGPAFGQRGSPRAAWCKSGPRRARSGDSRVGESACGGPGRGPATRPQPPPDRAAGENHRDQPPLEPDPTDGRSAATDRGSFDTAVGRRACQHLSLGQGQPHARRPSGAGR